MKNLFVLVCAVVLGFTAAQTLTIWSTGGDSDVEILEAAAERFAAANPGVRFDIQPISWDDAHTKILTAAVSGTGPDMITGGLSWGIEFGSLGGMLDLNEVAPEVVAKVAPIVHPGIYASVVSTAGEVYGVPLDLTVQMMVYRSDLLEAVGAASPPTTWNEMIDALDKLGGRGFALQWGNTNWLGYLSFLGQAGGSAYSPDCSEATINSPAGVEAAKFFAELYNTYRAPTDGWPDLETGLEIGDYAFGYTGNWVLNLATSRPELAEKVSFAPLPKGPADRSAAFIGGRIIGIMATSKNVDAAAGFIASIYDAESAKAMTDKAAEQGGFWVPPVIDFSEKIQAPDNIREALIAQLKDADGPSNCPGWEEAANTVGQQLQEIIFNGADPQIALDIAAREMNKLLNQ